VNKIKTDIDRLFKTNKNIPMPSKPVTGQTVIDNDSNLVIWDGAKWIKVTNIYDVINNIGYIKANAILSQVFIDEKIRNKVPAVMKAFEYYQTLLALAYSEKDNEN